MEWLTFNQGVILGQTVMLVLGGWFMADGTRTIRRQTKKLLEMLDTVKAMQNLIYCQKGTIAALQAGMIALEPIDLSDLPIEIRLKILAVLIDIGVQVRLPQEKK